MRSFKLPPDRKAFAEYYKEKFDEDLRDAHARITCEFYKQLFNRPRKTPAELKRLAASQKRSSRELEELITALPREFHHLPAELKDLSRYLNERSDLEAKRVNENARRLRLKRPEENSKGFLLACCAKELKNISIRYSGDENLPWVEEAKEEPPSRLAREAPRERRRWKDR
jgi:hypothetical protein